MVSNSLFYLEREYSCIGSMPQALCNVANASLSWAQVRWKMRFEVFAFVSSTRERNQVIGWINLGD